MAKALENLTMFVKGTPSVGPDGVFLTYNCVDGAMKSKQKVYEVPSPDFGDSPNTIWAAAVAQIKTNEGIT